VKRAFANLCALATLIVLASGCAYFRPSQTQEQRIQEEQQIAKDEYLKGSIFDGLVHSVFH
jgi:hypothetical protein